MKLPELTSLDLRVQFSSYMKTSGYRMPHWLLRRRMAPRKELSYGGPSSSGGQLQQQEQHAIAFLCLLDYSAE